MTRLRRHLRAWAMTWCLVQAAALASVLPVACCAAHEPAAAAETPPCHEAARVTQCPMRGAGGAPCPMHAGHDGSGQPAAHAAQDSHQTHDAPGSTPQRDCVIRSTCDGPTVFTVFSHAGLVPAALVADGPRVVDARPVTGPVTLAPTRSLPPEPRPPRA